MKRDAHQLEKLLDLFDFSKSDLDHLNSTINSNTLENIVKASSKVSPVKKKIDIRDCFRLQLWSGMSDDMWSTLKKSLKHLGRDILYSEKSIKKISKEEQEIIKKELGTEELCSTEGGITVNLKQTLLFLILLLSDSNIANRSTWKLMLDGRPKGNEFEVVVGITPMSFGKKVQSVNMVFPIAIYEGSEDRKELKNVLSKLITEINNLRSIKINDTIQDHRIDWIMVNDLKMTWELFSLPKGACPYCCCTTAEDRANFKKLSSFKTFTRKYKKGDLLFNIGIESKL